MKYYSYIGKALKNLIRKSGKTQREIARLLYISEGTMSNYVNDRTRPTPEMCVELSNFFGVTLDYLLGGEKEGLYVFRLEPDEKMIIECYRTSSPPKKKRILMQATSDGNDFTGHIY